MADAIDMLPVESDVRDRKAFDDIDRKVLDAQTERSHYEAQWEYNLSSFLGTTKPKGANKKGQHWFDTGRVQQSILTAMSVKTETPPSVSFAPRETNEPPEIFIKPEAAVSVQPGLLTPEQAMGEAPIDEMVVQSLVLPQVTGEMDPETGEQMTTQPLLTEADFVWVTDETAAKAMTLIWESMFLMTNGNEWLRENILHTSVYGHCDALVQWDAEENRVGLSNLYPHNTWIDRWANSTYDADHYIIREVLDEGEAKRLYPQFKMEIESQLGTNDDSSLTVTGRGRKYDVTDGDRQTIELVTMWERNYKYPMTEQEAIESGAVEIRPQFGVDDMGNAVEMPGEMFLAESDEPVAVESDNWPTRTGIRQIQMLGDIKVFDAETDFVDIPVARNKNIPVPDSPYGVGDPYRVRDLVELYNRLWSIVHDHMMFYRSPEQVMPQSVYDEIADATASIHSGAGRVLVIPDRLLFAINGDIIKTLSPPQIGTVVAELMRLVSEEIDRSFGIAGVLRGEFKSDTPVGVFEQATMAARGPIGYTARNTSDMIRHVAKVTADLIIRFLPLEEWKQYTQEYSEVILRTFKKRLKRFGYDIRVDVSASGTRERRISDLKEMMTLTGPTPTLVKTILELQEIPNAGQIVNEIQQQQAAAAQPMA